MKIRKPVNPPIFSQTRKWVGHPDQVALTRRAWLSLLAALPVVLGRRASAADRVPVIWDTDIGTDIDDALCLAYLCRQPACDLVGVTVTCGRVEERARLVKMLLEFLGRPNVPVHAGSSRNLNGRPDHIPVPQAEVLTRRPIAWQPAPDTAVDFLAATLAARPDEITLLATGPLTNLARLIQRKPTAFDLCRAVVLMNGYFGAAPIAEYNAAVDAEATRVVYQKLRRARVAGMDFTRHLTVPAAEIERRLRQAGLDPVAEMVAIFARANPVVTLHDPSAAMAIFEPDLIEWRPAARVISRAGFTFARPTPGAGIRIAHRTDKKRFIDRYFSVLNISN